MAGKIIINQVQLGDSATATQNFVLQTGVDGTAKLARGNSGATTQDILTVSATGAVAIPVAGPIGSTTPAAGTFTTLTTTGNTTLGDASTGTVTVNGYMGVGGGGNGAFGINVVNAALTGASQYGGVFGPTSTTAATSKIIAVSAAANAGDGAYTTTDAVALEAVNGRATTATITNQHGLYIRDLTRGTNNYGITSQVSSGTNKWNIYASGTAANYFAGNVGVGTNSPVGLLDVAGAGVGLIRARSTTGAGTVGFQAQNADTGTTSVDGTFFGIDGSDQAYVYNYENTPIIFGTNGAERLRIDSTGQVGIGLTPTTRNNTRLQIVDGIGFPATQVASTDANTLDDYREGTFTPTLNGTTTAGTGTYSVQLGKYTKIGNTVNFTIAFTWSAHTGTGSFHVYGLPFIAATLTGAAMPVTVYVVDVALSANNICYVFVGSNANSLTLRQGPTGGGAVSTIAVDTAGQLILSGTYFV